MQACQLGTLDTSFTWPVIWTFCDHSACSTEHTRTSCNIQTWPASTRGHV